MRIGNILVGAALIAAAFVYWRKPIVGNVKKTYNRLSRRGVKFIAESEGFRPVPYRDSGGKWTIGYGHLIKPGENFTRITREQALALLDKDAADAANAVNSLVRVPISINQFDALTSLVYNIGRGAFRDSTTLRELNRGNVPAAAKGIELWNKVTIGGVLTFVQGLANRRAAEKRLFLS